VAFAPFLAAAWLRRVEDVREIAPSLAVAVLGTGLVVALCLMPLYLAHPHFYLQFVQFFYQVQYEIWNGFAPMLSHAWRISRQSIFLLLATLPVYGIGMIARWRTGQVRETLAFFVAPLSGFALVIYARGHVTYWWYLLPWLLLIAVIVVADFWWIKRKRVLSTITAGWLAAWILVASAWPVKNYIIRMALPPEQKLTTNVQLLRAVIPKGAGVLTACCWWALGNDRVVYDPQYSDVGDLSRIEYFVTDGNGTGQPGIWVPASNPRYRAMLESFEVISDTLPRSSLQILGLRLTNSAYGHGTIILRRRISAETQ
jgi:hypothetical protein